MPFTEKKPPQDMLRCLRCGRLTYTRGNLIPTEMSPDHPVEMMIQGFTGGPGRGNKIKGTGFNWTPRDLTLAESTALYEVMESATLRLRDHIERLNKPVNSRRA